MGNRFRQHGIPCHMVSGFCGAASHRALNYGVGHAELEYQINDSVHRLSSGSITDSLDRIPAQSPIKAGKDTLITSIPHLTDEELFEAIVSFRQRLEVTTQDQEQRERERRLFGDGASSFDQMQSQEIHRDLRGPAFCDGRVAEMLDLFDLGDFRPRQCDK